MLRNLLIILLTSCVLFFNCNDPARINTGVVDQEDLNISLKEDFILTATTTAEDSVITYSPDNRHERYPCGIFEDPEFGITNAQLFFQIRYPITFSIPDFEDATADSLVLHLGLAESDPIYGDSTETHDFEVYEVVEEMDNAVNYYSNQSFETESTPLASFSASPNFNREFDISTFYFADTAIVDTLSPEISVKLDDALGDRLLALDSAQLQSNTEFLQVLNGINIRPVSTNKGLTSFRFENTGTYSGINYYTGRLSLYYTKDGVQREYSWVVDPTFSTKVINYDQDVSGAPIEDAIDNENIGQESLYIQGFDGTNAKIKIEGWDFPDDLIVNKAELEVYAEIEPENEELYPLPPQMILSEDVEGTLSFIRDFSLAAQFGNLTTSGGQIEEVEEGLYRYTLNISSHLQEIFDGDVSNEVFLRLFPKPSNVRRVIVHGPGHDTYPMKLVLTYTQL